MSDLVERRRVFLYGVLFGCIASAFIDALIKEQNRPQLILIHGGPRESFDFPSPPSKSPDSGS